jgi:hypothetical protein
MDLLMPIGLAAAYKSPAQIARCERGVGSDKSLLRELSFSFLEAGYCKYTSV